MPQTSLRIFEPIDERAAGSPLTIAAELHIIGEDNEANWITLDEVPTTAAIVVISGYTRVTGAPAAGEFRVYATAGSRLYGKVEFNAADNNKNISVAYDGLGTTSAAFWLRRTREHLRQNAVNFLSYQKTAIADYDTMMADLLADIGDGQTVFFPGNRTYKFDAHDLGADGHADMTWVGGPGCIFQKLTTGTFGATNVEHMFFDKASTCDGLKLIGIEFDLSRASATNGNTVSALMAVRMDNLTV